MIYVMSDIYGYLKAFNSIPEQIHLAETDVLYILGDVIDRHPYGIEILQKIMKIPNVMRQWKMAKSTGRKSTN